MCVCVCVCVRACVRIYVQLSFQVCEVDDSHFRLIISNDTLSFNALVKMLFSIQKY